MMSFRALLITSAVLAAASAEDQSTCSTIWLLKMPCSEPASALVSQVKAWSTTEDHDSQERCMYEIMKESPTALEIRRTSLDANTTTEMTFTFTPPGLVFCKMMAQSTTTSHNATMPNDYCLLYNLMNGSGLTHEYLYKEICNDDMCPSKESAICNNEE